MRRGVSVGGAPPRPPRGVIQAVVKVDVYPYNVRRPDVGQVTRGASAIPSLHTDACGLKDLSQVVHDVLFNIVEDLVQVLDDLVSLLVRQRVAEVVGRAGNLADRVLLVVGHVRTDDCMGRATFCDSGQVLDGFGGRVCLRLCGLVDIERAEERRRELSDIVVAGESGKDECDCFVVHC